MPIEPATARRGALGEVAASGTIVRRGRRLRAAPGAGERAWLIRIVLKRRADARRPGPPRLEAERWRRLAARSAPRAALIPADRPKRGSAPTANGHATGTTRPQRRPGRSSAGLTCAEGERPARDSNARPTAQEARPCLGGTAAPALRMPAMTHVTSARTHRRQVLSERSSGARRLHRHLPQGVRH
jgi:hypothetical protein